MGRFRDLWASGKYVASTKRPDEQAPESFEVQQEREAIAAMKELDQFAVPESSKQILAALSSRRGQETGRWLKDLVPGQDSALAEQQAAAVATQVTNASVFDDLVVLMDRLFKEFEELTYEFNKSA
ncbi:MAG: hypothetical protein ACRD3W_05965, partial [Terriglobales bacterium]